MLGAAFALIFKNLRDIDKIEKGEYNIREKTTFVTKSIHPEMEEVEAVSYTHLTLPTKRIV